MERSRTITVPQVATMLGISIPYAQKLIRDGAIPGFKVASNWCTTREAVEEYQTRRQKKKDKTTTAANKRL